MSGADVHEADGRLVQLSLDDLRREQLTVEILHAALDWVAGGGREAPSVTWTIRADARLSAASRTSARCASGSERGYRALASLTQDPARKVELVDMANAIRPRTWT